MLWQGLFMIVDVRRSDMHVDAEKEEQAKLNLQPVIDNINIVTNIISIVIKIIHIVINVRVLVWILLTLL